MTDPKLHKVVSEDLVHVARIVDILRTKYGPQRAAFMLEQVAKALRTGQYPNDGKAREIFTMRDQ